MSRLLEDMADTIICKRLRPGQVKEKVADFIEKHGETFFDDLISSLKVKSFTSSRAENLKHYIIENYPQLNVLKYHILRETFILLRHHENGGNIDEIRLKAYIKIEDA